LSILEAKAGPVADNPELTEALKAVGYVE